MLLAGVPALLRLPRPAPSGERRALRLGELADGVREVVRSPVLGPVALLSIALGALFIGPFQVVFPLLVRDYYKGDVAELSLLYTAFPVGTIVGLGADPAARRRATKGRGAAHRARPAVRCASARSGCGLPFWGALSRRRGLRNRRRVLHERGPHAVPGARDPRQPRPRALGLHPHLHGCVGRVGAPLAGLSECDGSARSARSKPAA